MALLPCMVEGRVVEKDAVMSCVPILKVDGIGWKHGEALCLLEY